MLSNEVPNDATLIILGTHSEYDLETRLEPGQDAKIPIDASPASPVYGHAQVGGARTA